MIENGAPAGLIPVGLLTAPDCHFCSDAREILRRLAGEYPLSIEEIDIVSPEGQEMAQFHGVVFPPGIFVDGECVGYGRPSERKLRRELARHAASRLRPVKGA